MLNFMFSRRIKKQQFIGIKSKVAQSGSYVVFDIETSGFNPEQHKIIEIGAVKVVDGTIVENFHSLISYKGRLKQEITQLTGIDPADLLYAPDKKTVLSDFFTFVGNYDLVGHNITQFDNKFLWFSALSAGLNPIKNGLIDTLVVARGVLPSDSYKLDYLCHKLGINIGNTHRALDDAMLTLNLFQKLNEYFDIDTSPEFIEYDSTFKYGQRTDAKYIVRGGYVDNEALVNKSFCITTFQKLHTFSSERELQQFIVDSGGVVNDNMIRKTDYLIDCDPVYVSAKEAKALEYIKLGKSDVKIISPTEFLTLAGL